MCVWMIIAVLGLAGISAATPLYTWVQVVERGMPDFNDGDVAQQASITTTPLHLSFPSGVDVMFVFVSYRGQVYAV